MTTTINRRTALRGTLGGASIVVGLPLLDCFLNGNGTAIAASQPSTRLCRASAMVRKGASSLANVAAFRLLTPGIVTCARLNSAASASRRFSGSRGSGAMPPLKSAPAICSRSLVATYCSRFVMASISSGSAFSSRRHFCRRQN